jgi:HSP20 family molecular chaperone IbpA
VWRYCARLDRDRRSELELIAVPGEDAMSKKAEHILGQFERTIDEFFDELLIDRWRAGVGNRFEQGEVIDHPDSYEIRVTTEGIDPAKIEVESLGQRLTVRAPVGPNRNIESSFRFAEAIDAEAASARWTNGVLTVILPKQKTRRIRLKES